MTTAQVYTLPDEEDWKMPYPLRPAPNTRYGQPIWQRRIGRLLPRAEDK